LIQQSDDPIGIKDFDIYGPIYICCYPEDIPLENVKSMFPSAQIYTTFSTDDPTEGLTIQKYI